MENMLCSIASYANIKKKKKCLKIKHIFVKVWWLNKIGRLAKHDKLYNKILQYTINFTNLTHIEEEVILQQ